MASFKRLNVSIDEYGKAHREIETVSLDGFHHSDLLIRVAFSGLNYKDALSANGNKGVSRYYPHTPGIDAAGEIVKSNNAQFKPGDQVIVTGYDLGMNTRGGFSEYISVPSHWAIHLPENLSLEESMILGTAGLTAAMSVDKIRYSDLYGKPVIVSGATGGVGSLSLMILKRLGIRTVALSRKTESLAYLKSIGADEVIHRFEDSVKPLLKGQYSAGIDVVGGHVLENMIKQIGHNGSLAICGLALSPHFNTSVFPFILRGLSLFGIESAEADMQWRKALWQNLAGSWKPEGLHEIARTVRLSGLESEIVNMLAGNAHGRVLVDLR